MTQITCFCDVLMLFLETATIFSELSSCQFLYFTDTVFHDSVTVPVCATELLSKQLIQHVSDYCLHITCLYHTYTHIYMVLSLLCSLLKPYKNMHACTRGD